MNDEIIQFQEWLLNLLYTTSDVEMLQTQLKHYKNHPLFGAWLKAH